MEESIIRENRGTWAGMNTVTLIQWQDRFGTEETCQDYLFQQRWPNGFVCPKCQRTKCWTVHRSGRTGALYECSACGHQDSINAEMIFHRTKVFLRVWFFGHFPDRGR